MGKGLIAGATALLVLLSGVLSAAVAPSPRTYVPANAARYAPVLVATQQAIWPSAPEPWTFAGQVEQESCITLTHRRCWDPTAELKTAREYGFGFGQITTAYRKDGSVRFNKFEELVAAYPSLQQWKWDDRYNAAYQITALIEMDKTLFSQVRSAASIPDQFAFTLAAYNGGMSGVLQDRLLCSNTKGCNQAIWFGNVENTSLKTRVVNPGYGKSAFAINREYVTNVLLIRRAKYHVFWEK